MSRSSTPLTWLDSPKTPTALYALTPDSFWVATTFMADLTPSKVRIDQGEEPAEVLGKSGVRYPLKSLTRVECDQRRRDLVVSWTETDPDGKSKAKTKTYGGNDQSVRDAVFEALRQRLAPDWQLTTREAGRVEMTGGSIILVIGGLLVTWLASLLFHWLEGIELSVRPSGSLRGTIGRWVFRFVIQPILRLIGSTGGDYLFMGIAALIVFLGVLMIVTQIRKPSLWAKLEPAAKPVG